MMKILFDIGHPAHVHLFRNIAISLAAQGNEVLFTVREKECSIPLLQAYKLPFLKTGKNYHSLSGKIFGLFINELLLFKVAFRFHADIYVSHGSFYAAFVAFILGKQHIAMEDTGNMEQVRLYLPFTTVVLSPSSFKNKISKKQLFYNGYHELAYLHPEYFSVNNTIENSIGINDNSIIILLRFIARRATHDIGYSVLSDQKKIEIVNYFSAYGKVFVSSEDKLPDDLMKFKLNIPPEKFHYFMNKCSLVFGNSATVTSEAAMLGIPAIFIDNEGRNYTHELEEKYGLVFNFKETYSEIDQALVKAAEILKILDKKKWKILHEAMLADKINVTKFLTWFIINFPESHLKMKNEPAIQWDFK